MAIDPKQMPLSMLNEIAQMRAAGINRLDWITVADGDETIVYTYSGNAHSDMILVETLLNIANWQDDEDESGAWSLDLNSMTLRHTSTAYLETSLTETPLRRVRPISIDLSPIQPESQWPHRRHTMSDLTSKQQLEEVERLRVQMTQAILAETGLIVDIDCNIFYHDQPTQDLVTAAQELGWKREKHDGGLITIGSQPISPKTTVFSITHRE